MVYRLARTRGKSQSDKQNQIRCRTTKIAKSARQSIRPLTTTHPQTQPLRNCSTTTSSPDKQVVHNLPPVQCLRATAPFNESFGTANSFSPRLIALSAQIVSLKGTPVSEQSGKIDHCLAEIVRLSAEISDALSYIPTYDQRTYFEVRSLAFPNIAFALSASWFMTWAN